MKITAMHKPKILTTTRVHEEELPPGPVLAETADETAQYSTNMLKPTNI